MRHLLIKSLALVVLFTVQVNGYQATESLQQIGTKAVVVIKKRRTESLNGYLLMVCKASSWKALEKDSDLGPFLRHKKAAANLDTIVAMPSNPKNGSTYGIYFQDNKPIGFVEIKTGKGEKISEANVAKAYVPLTEEPNESTLNPIRFEEGRAFSDDDVPIPTLQVVDDGGDLSTEPKGDFRSGAIKTAGGYLAVWNQPNNYYTLEITGKDVQQTSSEHKHFSVDGMFLQIVDAPISDFVQAAQRQSQNDKAILEAHREWEAKFLEEAYKSKLKTESSWQKLTNGKDALLWFAGIPEGIKTNVKKQVYLTVVKGDYVLLLGGAVTDTDTDDAVKQLLLKTIETLKPSDKPTDLQKMRDAILKGGPRDRQP